MIAFKERLRLLRIEKELSQADLAEIIHVTRLTISNYELGRREPDFTTLFLLADFFGVSVDFLLGRSETRNEGDAGRLDKMMPEAEAALKSIPPKERNFIILLLTDMMKNFVKLRRMRGYGAQQLYSALALNVCVNDLTLLMDDVINNIVCYDGSDKYMTDDQIAENVKNIEGKSYNVKLEMIKTADLMQDAFMRELASIMKKAGLQTDFEPGPKNAVVAVRQTLEAMFNWEDDGKD